MIKKQNGFNIIADKNQLKFYDRSWYWETDKFVYYPHEIEFARFLFNELFPRKLDFDSTNFLITDKFRQKRLHQHRKHTEEKLRNILRDNEW